MAEAYLTGRYMTCAGCYCWMFFHGVSDPGQKELLVSKGFALWTESVIKADRPGESSYYLDTYELESDDSRVHFDHIIDLISGDPLLFALLKKLRVGIGLWWYSVSGQGGPTFSRKQQNFLWANEVRIAIKISDDSCSEVSYDPSSPANPYDYECWCGFRVYGHEGVEHLKQSPIPEGKCSEGIRWDSHAEEDFGSVFIYGSAAEEHAPLCAKQLEELLLSNVGLGEFCKKQVDTYDPLGREHNTLDYGLITCGRTRRVSLDPDFWRLALELGCNAGFYFTMFPESGVSNDRQG